MHTNIIHISPADVSAPECNKVLSFRPFLEYIKSIHAKTNSHKKYFFAHVIEEFEKYPQLLKSANLDEMKNYEHLMELVYSSLSKMVEDEEVNFWALSIPMKPIIFYSTNAFYNLLSGISGIDSLGKVTSSVGSVQIEGNPAEFVYAVVMEKYYGIPSFFSKKIVHAVEDTKTGLTRYYEASLDTKFIDIIPEGQLPELKFDMLQSGNFDREEKLQWMKEVLPLNLFRFEGFGITTVKDVSVKYAVDNIKEFLLKLKLDSNDNYFSEVIHWLKIIVESNDIEFGLLPALYVNQKLVFNEGLYTNSVLINAAKNNGMEEINYLELIDEYFRKPKLIFFSEITEEEKVRHSYLKFLAADGIFSYSLIPLYFGNSLVGVLETYSRKKVTLDEALLAKLEPVTALLSQLLKNGIHEFHDGIEKVIKNKFTSVQPSVQWKFNEAAWHFIRDKQIEGRSTEIEDIYFDDVYPLYGAIDIRNSTLERNAALNRDMQVQLTALITMLEKLKRDSGFALLDEKIFLAKKWLKEIASPESFNQQILLNDFLENNIMPFLADFKKGNATAEAPINEYLTVINDLTGAAFENRRVLEKSMNKVVSAVNNYLDKMQEDIQLTYPGYFEKFRTDGVEYDIYIGQSIAPEKPFSDIYLKNLRLLQLNSMATIAKFTASMIAGLPVNVQTTQLIFIHSQSIGIKFRKDEKRFDVEGSYNIRYHVVKKRIDKVLIKGTDERLTQPDKIALVYINQQDAGEYISYIEYLQGEGVLCNDLEELELEELQGVSGLKALRVGVVKDEKTLGDKVSDAKEPEKATL